MSGLGNFGLSSLGSMSTLGSLAQSAQRLDRLMAGNRSSRQDNSWNRNNSRRSVDDDFFGGRSSRRRSMSPPRRFNRDDRRSNDRRDRGNQRRSRDDNIYGSTAGAGILGAAPSRNDGPVSSGLGELGGSSWNDNGSGGLSNINSQTQQLLNMMQTQQLLAAVQAQAKLATQSPPSLMQSQGYGRRGGRMMEQRGGGRFNRNDRRPLGYGRDDRKRRRSPPPRPFKRERRDGDNATRKDQDGKKTATQIGKDAAKKDAGSKQGSAKDAKTAKGGEGKDNKEETMAESETKVTKNAAGENVDELVKTNYDNKRYWCTLCKIVCLKTKNIYKHFLSERHVKATVEKEGKIFDPEMMKEPEVKKEKPKPKEMGEFLKYVCNTKKTARKENNDIFISSLTDCTVKITDFASGQDFMGSEFVKAISGFKCQLCNTFMRHGFQVLQHLQGKRHKLLYQEYIKANPKHLENQREVNKDLMEMLKKDEGHDVVLYEGTKDDESAGDVHQTDEVEQKQEYKEEEFNMNEFDPTEDSKVDDDSKMADETTFEDSAIDDSIQDLPVDDNEEKEFAKKKAEESEEKMEAEEVKEEREIEKEVEKEVAKTEVELKKEDVKGMSEEKDKELLMEADEEEEEFPLLEPINPVKEEPVQPEPEDKPEVLTSTPDVAASTPEVETKPDKLETPTPSELAVEPEEEPEDLTPTRRGRKARRGRGGVKATRGKPTRRTPRGAKNAKKAEEIVVPEEEAVPAPVVTEKEKEKVEVKEPEPEVPVQTESAELIEIADSMEEQSLSQETISGDVEGIDGFEVIDEIEGGDDDEDNEEDD